MSNTKRYQIALSLVPGVGDVIDKIVEALKWSAPKVAQVLLQLEFKGIIVLLPGKVYQKCD